MEFHIGGGAGVTGGAKLADMTQGLGFPLREVSSTSTGVEGVGGPFGLANTSPFYDEQLETLITPTFAATSQIGSGVIIGDLDFTKYQLQASIASYMTSASGFQRSLTPNAVITPTVRSFWYTGQTFEIRYRTLASDFRVYVDGVLVSQYTSTTTNAPDYALIDLGSAKTRRIDIVARNEYWGGLVVEPSTVITPTRDDQPEICVIGDSFTSGTGSTLGNTYVNTLMRKLNSYNICAMGVGGAGYNNGAAGETFIERLSDATDRSPDWIITAGGINDLGFTEPQFQAAVDAYYAQLLASGIPESRIVIVSPWFGTNATATALSFRDILEAKAAEIGAFFIDALGDGTDGWTYGTGNEGAPTGDGNADIVTTSDGTHPTPYGHFYLGWRLAEALLYPNPAS